ncbi:MAG TPA: HlyD family efflux transporter periplasmic adaptor subunit [Allosphingosinicella sp.]
MAEDRPPVGQPGAGVNQTRALFRSEAVRFNAERLYGEVSLAVPPSWQLVGYVLLTALAAACAFLFLASYSRSETVSGVIALDTGVATVAPSRSGIVASIQVREGQRVEKGALLMRIRAAEDMAGGATASERIRQALAEQDSRLAGQGASYQAAASAERERALAQIAGLSEEIGFLERQISDQRLLLTTAGNDLAEVQRVAKSGYISRRDVEAREATVILRRQQLAQLEQARAAKASQLSETRRTIAQSSASARAQVATAQTARAALAQQVTEAELAEGYVLTAPVAGVVTGLTGRIGQRVRPDQPVMMILPAEAKPNAELRVQTSAAGFLAPGQEVRLAVDAFPYQRFGTILGRIESISSAAFPSGDDKDAGATYLVIVTLARPSVEAFGRPQPLRPGMTVSARIITAKRSLFEWLFEPVLAVGRR